MSEFKTRQVPDILPSPQRGAFSKDDGEVVVDAEAAVSLGDRATKQIVPYEEYAVSDGNKGLY